jgi:hypothetical protein
MILVKNCQLFDRSRAFYGMVDLEILETPEGCTGILHWDGYDLPLSSQRQYSIERHDLGELLVKVIENTKITSRCAEFVVKS